MSVAISRDSSRVFSSSGARARQCENSKKAKIRRISKSAVTPTYGGFRRSKLENGSGFGQAHLFVRGSCSGTVQNTRHLHANVKTSIFLYMQLSTHSPKHLRSLTFAGFLIVSTSSIIEPFAPSIPSTSAKEVSELAEIRLRREASLPISLPPPPLPPIER